MQGQAPPGQSFFFHDQAKAVEGLGGDRVDRLEENWRNAKGIQDPFFDLSWESRVALKDFRGIFQTQVPNKSTSSFGVYRKAYHS